MGKRKVSSDKFGRHGTFGYPTDLGSVENGAVERGQLFGGQHTFTSALLRSLFRMSDEQGNPRSIMQDKEEGPIREEVRLETAAWLVAAMQRLPKNQEVCIFLRFRFDSKGHVEEGQRRLRTETEIAQIVGVSQSTVFRNIRRGLNNLRKDYELNLKDRLDEIDS